MSDAFITIVVMLVAILLILCLYLLFKKNEKEYLKEFHRISIGDKYVWTVYSSSPFEEPVVSTAKIVDKKLDRNGRPWVRYLVLEESIQSVHDEEFDWFLIHYKKVQ